MQVEFFEGGNPKSLQDKINTWLKDHSNIATHLIVQTPVQNNTGKLTTILITLWYSEHTGLPNDPSLPFVRGVGLPRGFPMRKG